MIAPSKNGRANRHRGELEVRIGGENRILCLTLGALAELETAFAAESLAALAERFSGGRLKAADLILILGAALRGGGNDFSDEDVAVIGLDHGLPGLVTAVTELLAVTFCEPDRPGGGKSPRP